MLSIFYDVYIQFKNLGKLVHPLIGSLYKIEYRGKGKMFLMSKLI